MRAGLAIVLALVIAACGEPVEQPAPRPANLMIVTNLSATGTAGAAAGIFAVRVTDADDAPVRGVLVQFAASLGGGSLSSFSDTTDAEGTASTTLTLSPVPGPNEVSALVAGLPEVRSTVVTGTIGAARTISLSPRLIRFGAADMTLNASAIPRDAFGNIVPGEVTWTSRDPALVSIAPGQGSGATATVAGRPGSTYVVASFGDVSDSIPVAVLDNASTPCAFTETPIELAVGGTLSLEGTGRTCVRATEAAEYALVSHYNTAIATAAANLSVVAHGVVLPPVTPQPSLRADVIGETLVPSFEAGLRARERAEIGRHVAGARAWHAARARMPALTQVSRIGDVTEVNVNAFEFCAHPDSRPARVAAITPGTLILEDQTNPLGGFTAEEYHAIAMAVDTLVMPVDTSAFGSPTDIDGNGRIAILFTRAVNELTPRGSVGGIVLGFFFSRDLLPKVSAAGSCPGSNVAEMFYVLVPDPSGVLSDVRSKSFVQSITIGAIAHELQHLINASRRLYVNRSVAATEEVWLNEGLSHIAEELLFYRTSGLDSRQNIGAGSLVAGSTSRDMHDLFMRGNFGRFASYLLGTSSNSPLAFNDLLATRGASWSFLRYASDRIGTTDGDFWRRLVNSQAAGVVNLDEAMAGSGLRTLDALRDWSVSLVVDDLIAATLPPRLTQPSWNFATAMPQVGFSFAPVILPLGNGVPMSMQLRAGGTMYNRLIVPAGNEALVQVASGGGVAQPGIRLTLIRTK